MIRLLLLTETRSGTMMLTDALDAAYPQLQWYNLYASNPDNPRGHHNNWLKYQDTASPGVTHKGTTMHRVEESWINMLSPVSPKDFWRVLAERHDRHVLLHRTNLLRRYLSIQVGILLRSYQVQQPRRVDPGPVRIDIQDLFGFIGEAVSLRRRVDEHFPNRMTVTYEELASNWKATTKSILQYLGLPLRPLPQVTYRQERRSLRDAIQNYEEVRDYLRHRGYDSWTE